MTPSRIINVAVHARGAVVTRAVEVPSELPAGEVDLVVGGITPHCDPGTVRAELRGSREVISLQAALHVPSETARAGASVEKVAELLRRRDRLDAELAQVEGERAQLQQLSLSPGLRMKPADERLADSLAASSLVNDLLAALDARRAALTRALRELQHQIESAALEDAQRTTADRMGSGHPTRQVTVRLGSGGAVESLTLSYQVRAARWWPVYTLRLSEGGSRAAWWLEALVAQRTGEDWRDVKLSLSTADLIHDARLPELPSLRLGRKQPPPKKAYRPPPEGLDEMFAAYDRACTPPVSTRSFGGDATRAGAIFESPPPPPAPQAMPEAQFEYEEVMAPRKSRSLLGGLFPGGGGSAPMAPASMAFARREAPADLPPEPEPAAAIEPDDAWLDFDRLAMSELGAPQRGRLRLEPEARTWADDSLESLAPEKTRDPLASRGLFDHRYDAAGVADVPSDGLPQRVTVGVREAPCRLHYRSVPREAPEVFREARLENPFAAPLLAGPVDVYVEGSLLLASDIERIDVGGEMTVGLGVEERIRVARNARVEESSAGLLGGSVVVDSEVTIDLTSSLGRDARVEIADRIPVTDEDDLTVALVSSKPAHEDYDQKERGAPIRKGLRWLLPLAASGKGQIVFRYKLTFPSKNELAGGNRRE